MTDQISVDGDAATDGPASLRFGHRPSSDPGDALVAVLHRVKAAAIAA